MSRWSSGDNFYYTNLIFDPRKRRYILTDAEKLKERKLMYFLRHQRELLLFAKGVMPPN